MTEYLSKKLRWLSILMTVLVVIIHAFNFDYLIDGDNPIINCFFFSPSVDIGRSAVPLFFLISGLLFFKDSSSFSLSSYRKKITKRVKTVLIPYLIVSAFVMLLAWFSHRDFIPYYLRIDHLLAEYSLKNILMSWIVKPQAYYLWFLRNLFVLALFSPLIYWLVKKGSWLFISVSLAAWMLMPNMLPSPTLSIIFFSLGAFISIKQIRLPEKVKLTHLISVIVIWLIFVILSKQSSHLPSTTIMIFLNVYTFVGIIIAWLSYDYISPKFVEKVNRSLLAHHIFCVYLFHPIFLTIITQISLHFAEKNTIEVVLPMYYISIPLSIIFSILLASAIEKFIPSAYKTITGNR